MAKQYHPDMNKDDKQAASKFQEVTVAYDTLKDEQKRKMYDSMGHDAFKQHSESGGGGGPAPEDIAEMLRNMGFGGFPGFGGFGGDVEFDLGGMGMGGPKNKGADIETSLRISFMEAVKGSDKEIKYTAKVKCTPCSGSGSQPGHQPATCKSCGGRGMEMNHSGFMVFSQPCRACGGQGKIITHKCGSCSGKGTVRDKKTVSIHIPPGIDSGATIKILSQGEAADRGGKPGSLYVTVQVDPHEYFKRNGLDVALEVPLTLSQATLGATIKVPTLDGTEEPIKVPAGTQPGDKRVLRGRGVKLSTGRTGDELVQFKVQVPTHLTARQKELMEEFAKEESKNRPSGSFFKDSFGKIRDFMGKQKEDQQ